MQAMPIIVVELLETNIVKLSIGQGLVTRRYYWKPEVSCTIILTHGHSQSHDALRALR